MVSRPESLSRYATFDTKHFPEIFQIGHEAALERMDEIRRVIERGA